MNADLDPLLFPIQTPSNNPPQGFVRVYGAEFSNSNGYLRTRTSSGTVVNDAEKRIVNSTYKCLAIVLGASSTGNSRTALPLVAPAKSMGTVTYFLNITPTTAGSTLTIRLEKTYTATTTDYFSFSEWFRFPNSFNLTNTEFYYMESNSFYQTADSNRLSFNYLYRSDSVSTRSTVEIELHFVNNTTTDATIVPLITAGGGSTFQVGSSGFMIYQPM